jgi:hypothetical protein
MRHALDVFGKKFKDMNLDKIDFVPMTDWSKFQRPRDKIRWVDYQPQITIPYLSGIIPWRID